MKAGSFDEPSRQRKFFVHQRSTHCTRRQFLHCFPREKFDLTDLSFVSNSVFSPVLKIDDIDLMNVSHEPRYAFHAFSCHQYYVPVQIVVYYCLSFSRFLAKQTVRSW
jgi:hypothetical protein